ncbi:MAG: cation transporter [Nitrospina sp.]|jgi:cation diffusion facilitator family transporter|nr:cation transporter [Nitrospina sp.]MBT3509876.1 cation transporter [Nitrospina sp.]MBT3874491.1 cation transporter [Nitrospina sp.]MBT4049124.1 cation transporter [Nitrospina sp.]MBT4559162.1 cation transporter [Nitrospina sp.]
MSDSCSHLEEELAQGSKRKILWLVLFINLTMFFVEGIGGWLAQSNALMADALDMLGDSVIYGFSLFVIQLDPIWRTRAGILKGLIMSVFALGILGSAIYRVYYHATPDASTMGVIGGMALAANLFCAYLLLRFKNDDINMRSAWLCSRNDVLANLGVLVAAGGVAWTSSHWPDLAVGVIIAALILQSSFGIFKDAQLELNAGRDPSG